MASPAVSLNCLRTDGWVMGGLFHPHLQGWDM
jgi:hypothetical protein